MAPSSSSIGAPAARQPSRKGKAAWRKNVDLAPVEAALEAARARERDGSGSAGAPLFVEDRVGDEAVGARMARARRAQKPLRSLEVLRSTSAVPPVAGRARAGVAAGATALQASGMSKKQKDKLRRSAGRAVKGPFGAVVESEQGKGKEKEAVADAEYDLWQQPSAADGKRKADESSNEWLAAAMEKSNNKPRKAPRTLAAARPKIAPAAVVVPHEGQSYNPPAEAHDELLSTAGAAAVRAEKLRLKDAAYKKGWKAGAEVAAFDEGGQRVRGMLVGAGDAEAMEGSDEDVEEDVPEASADEDAEPKNTDPKRKTKAQRARAARVKAEAAARMAAKALRMQRASLLSLPALKKAQARAERERLAAAAAKQALLDERRLKDGLRGERVGKFRVPEQEIDVQLGEELAEGLRTLKPEGNLFRDRFDSLTARGLAEPRKLVMPQAGTQRGGMKRRKEVETHSYKRFV